ncbi:HutD/Ves family protein [Gordonia aquimaris]|uniref:HutD family protein n=1 Tax=Gordonia aquimaris TaxID=2984863 RepID=A0A9X3D2M1_9ACTN|nr:HutD family protein [Gordonia aquimaris]MCX2963535.1 HutD family protein [Gordonia aquimaris]
MTIVRAADLVATPWRNGVGVTRRISTGGHPESPDWTLSIADIAAPGRFSLFPGLDRTAVVVGDEPLDLTINDATRTIALLDRVSFAGEDVVDATPTRRPTRLLNLMTRRGRCLGELSLRHIRGSVNPGPDDGIAWMVLAGRLVVGEHDLRRWDTVFLADPRHEIRGAATVAAVRLQNEENP